VTERRRHASLRCRSQRGDRNPARPPADRRTARGDRHRPLAAERVRALGATPVAVDLLDARAVRKAVIASEPEAIAHQATALANLRDLKHFDQGEDDPLDPTPVPAMRETIAAMRHLDEGVTEAGGIALLYGTFYEAANDGLVERAKPPRRFPRWLARLLAGEAVVMMETEARGASNAKAERELGWELRYPSWREGFVAAYASTAPTHGHKSHPAGRTVRRPLECPTTASAAGSGVLPRPAVLTGVKDHDPRRESPRTHSRT
jgi:hypothetical protein